MDMGSDIVAIENERILELMSVYLNNAPDSVTVEDIQALGEFDVPVEEAFALTLAGLLDLDIADDEADREFYRKYFPYMFRRFEAAEFAPDPYLAGIEFPTGKIGSASFDVQAFAPYEGFVYDDFEVLEDGRIIPKIGFFEERYEYSTAMEDGRIWMSVTPQEIITVAPAIERAHGKVLTYGLGLGYFTYMASLKRDVDSVTVVEGNLDMIRLFERGILPQFEQADKVDIVYSDAFDYAGSEMAAERFDFVYTDIWHDVGDGIDLYLRMKGYEDRLPGAEFMYWIEPTLKCYL